MGWTAVVNPAAGRGYTRRLLPRLEEALRARGARVEVSSGPEEPTRLATEAVERGDGIIACGGDGLVALLAGIASEADTALAVVPTGAGNDFARALGLRVRKPLDALAVLDTGRERRVDLGRADGRWFTSVANTGFDAEANRWANGVQRLGGTTLYLAAIARTLGTYRPHRFSLRVDDDASEEFDAWLVAFANTATYAGGMRVAPAAEIDDGLLDITLIRSLSRPRFIVNLPRVFWGGHVHHPAVTTKRGRRFEISSLDDSVPMELYASGERVGRLPGVVEVVPGALRVLAP